MSADIFNAWEVLAASTVATIITGGVAVAWAQGRLSVAEQYWAAGEAEFDKAERLQAEVERTRNLPWYWPTGPAVVPSDPDVTGELLAVEPGRTYQVGENGPVLLALSDRPAEDEDEVGDEQPGEARWSWLRFIAATLLFPFAWLLYRASPVAEYVADKWAEYRQTRRERDQVGTGDRCVPRTDAEIRAELAELTGEPVPPVLDPDGEALVELEAWVAANPPTNPTYKRGPDGQRHWNDLTAQYEVVKPGRHRAEGYAINVPLQREGDADV